MISTVNKENRMPKEEHGFALFLRNLPKLGHWGSCIVYITMGLLVLLATIGSNPRRPDVQGSLLSIKDQPGGSFLLCAILVCLLCLFVWRVLQAFWDLEEKGTSARGLMQRAGFLGGAILLLGVSFLILKILLNQPLPQTSAIAQQQASELTRSANGWIVLVLLGSILAIMAGWYSFLGLRGNFRGVFQCEQMSHSETKWCFALGRIGFIARGMMVGAIAYFIIRAGLEANSNLAFGQAGTLEAMLTTDLGTFISVLIGLGLIGFGCYEFAEAKYGRLPDCKLEKIVRGTLPSNHLNPRD